MSKDESKCLYKYDLMMIHMLIYLYEIAVLSRTRMDKEKNVFPIGKYGAKSRYSLIKEIKPDINEKDVLYIDIL
ncbi:hypothetical protein A3Q56_00396 [Intoshia linei]|uniref:Uncharacterized protein n=1 Tax=Intoshia linei TaxID=1819745 RepID=A0A177BC98_9BILA|nr:hypothetical protein A3Q56_00396 [Intoshia linei]